MSGLFLHIAEYGFDAFAAVGFAMLIENWKVVGAVAAVTGICAGVVIGARRRRQ